MFKSGKSYEKDYENCEYMKKISDIPMCIWNHKPCIRVEYSLCAKYDTEDTNNKVNNNE